MQCPKCAFENPPEMRFCGGCGGALGACPTCGKQNPPGFAFCGHCGGALGSAALAEPARKEPVVDQAERRQITVMFCDLVGSTALSEQLDPEDLRNVVRAYHERAEEVVRRYDGHIAQYLGDGVLVYFGYPRAHEDDARRAVDAGLEIVSAIEALARDADASELKSLAVRVGVHTGPVVAGEVGAGATTERLALGPTPNIAARVQGLAKPGQVVLTAATYSLIDARVECESLGMRELKGIANKVEVYRALGSRVDGEEREEAFPFVGRGQEIAWLVERAEAAARGEGQAVLIRGEAGIGKSRLQGELRKRTGSSFRQWLTGRCSEHHQNTMLFPVLELLEREVGMTPRDDAAQRREKLERWQPVSFPPDQVETLVRLLSLSEAPRGPIGPREKLRRFDALLNALTCAAGGPLTLVVEDLHWADPSTLDFLEHALRDSRTLPILILLSARSKFEASWRPFANELRFDLERFNDAESRALIQACWRESLPEDMERELLERSDGVPLFLEEMTQALSASGIKGERLIPLTLRDSLMARLDNVGPAKEVAQLGAVLGRRFSGELLEAVSELPEQRLAEFLDRIVETGLLQRRGQGQAAVYVFKHALLQDLAYDSLLLSRRRQLHGRVAQILKNRFPQLAETQPEVFARHFEGAEDFSSAIEFYVKAGDHSTARAAYVEAVRSLEKALSLVRRQEAGASRDELELKVLTQLTFPVAANRGYGSLELGRTSDRMLELVDSTKDPTARLYYLVTAWGSQCARGERDSTRVTAGLVAELAETTKRPAFQQQASWVCGCTAFYGGDQVAADRFLDEAARGPNPHLLSRLIGSWSMTLAGKFTEALQVLQTTIDGLDAGKNPFELAQALCHLAVVRQDLHLDIEGVEEIGDRVIRISLEHDMPIWVEYGELARNWVRARRGSPSGIEDLQAAFGRCYPNPEVTIPHSLMMIADALFALGRFTDAMQATDRALAFSKSNLAVFYEPEARRLKGELLCRGGDLDLGLQWLYGARDQAKRQGAGLLELRSLNTLAEFEADGDRREEVLSGLREIVARHGDEVRVPHLERARELLV